MEAFFNAEYIIRLFLALALGFSLGLERELTNKYAGLRTHILVCLGACIFTLLSIYAFPTFATGDNVDIAQATGIRDTSRVAAQIVTGIGFIGAGTVLRNCFFISFFSIIMFRNQIPVISKNINLSFIIRK